MQPAAEPSYEVRRKVNEIGKAPWSPLKKGSWTSDLTCADKYILRTPFTIYITSPLFTMADLQRKITNISAELSLANLDQDLQQHDVKVSLGGTVRAYSHDSGSGPVLCMVHGYPESAFM